MKKTLLTLALCAASLMGTASAAGLSFSMIDEEILQIQGDGTFEDVVTWFGQEERPFISFVTLDEGTTIHLGAEGGASSTVLPYCGTFQMLHGTTFTFDELLTLTHNPDTDGPVFYTGSWVPGFQQGDLTLDVSADALDTWFKQSEDHTHLMEFTLVDQCMFNNTNGPVHCTFAGIEKGDIFQYGDETYENVGIITEAKLLEPGQIALLFRPTGQNEQGWVYGTFSLVAVGSQYVPVPEPATGTLSLLALAGLAARRRRK